MDARQRIIRAAIRLMKKNGLQGATTRAIAQAANVNEVTLFRQFGSKRNLFQNVLSKLVYVPEMSELFPAPFQYELESDLLLFAKTYQDVLTRNRDLITILLNSSDQGTWSEIDERLRFFPQQMTNRLCAYLAEMQQRGLLVAGPIEPQAMAFMSLNLGCFIYKTRVNSQLFLPPEEDFLFTSVKTFSRGISA